MLSFFPEQAAEMSIAVNLFLTKQSSTLIGIAVTATATVAAAFIARGKNRDGKEPPEGQAQGNERDLTTSYTQMVTWADGPVSESHAPAEATSFIRKAGDPRVLDQADQISTLRQQSFDAMKTDAWLGKHEDAVSELKRLVQGLPPSRPSPP